MKQKKSVLVGVSGGVDSTAALLLLKEQGYEVAGATFVLFDREQNWQDLEDAKEVCKALSVPHYVLDLKDAFEREVLSYFCRSYMEGKTPNPCVACNKNIKFGVFIEHAKSLGFDFVATGHYAQVFWDENGGGYVVKKALSQKKDQSYMLYTLTQEQLSHMLLPLGLYEKEEIRQLVEAAGLKVARKPESQDICFIPNGDYASFIANRQTLPEIPGDFLDKNGQVIGHHKGYYHYTIGQRRGIGQGFGERVYVTAINAKNNTVTLGQNENLLAKNVKLTAVHFISEKENRAEISCTAKLRYAGAPQEAVLIASKDGQSAELRFADFQRAITPGQSAVVYEGDVLLGGGEIVGAVW